MRACTRNPKSEKTTVVKRLQDAHYKRGLGPVQKFSCFFDRYLDDKSLNRLEIGFEKNFGKGK